MLQRRQFGTLLLLAGVALAAWRVGSIGAQSDTPARSAWASTGVAVPQSGNKPPSVIASTRPGQPLVPQPVSHLPLPDDGLQAVSALKARKPVAQTETPRVDPRLLPRAITPLIQPTSLPESIHQANPIPTQVGGDGSIQLVSGVGVEQPTNQPTVRGSCLSVDIVGPATAAPGQGLPCTLVVKNHSPFVIAGVRIELPLPQGTRLLTAKPEAEKSGPYLRWGLGNIEAGATRRIEVELQATDSGELHLMPAATFSSAFGLRTNIIQPAFGLTVKAPETASVGDKVIFQIQVGNNTKDPMRRVHLRCDMISGLLHPQGTTIEAELEGELAPGQVRTVRLEAQAKTPGKHRMVLSAKHEGGQVAQNTTMITIHEMTLALDMKGPRSGGVGQELAFVANLYNPGRNASGIIHLSQSLPAGLEFVNASHNGIFNPGTQMITWSLPALHGEQRLAVTFKVRAKRQGDWALAMLASSEGLSDVRATHAIQIEATPSLTLEAIALDDPIGVGNETLYEIRVYNGGPASARDVRMAIRLPENLLPISAEGPSKWSIQGHHVFFEPVPEMQARVDAMYRVRVRGIKAGEGRFQIDVHAGGLTRPLSRELTSRIKGSATPLQQVQHSMRAPAGIPR